MKPGHPYLTEELDDLRSAQRRLLARMPNRWINTAFPPFKKDYDPGAVYDNLVDRHRLESDFRTLVQSQFADAVEWLTERQTPFRPEDVQHFLDSRLQNFDGNANDLYEAAMQQRQAEAGDDQPVALQPKIHRVIGLLIWADELADDGYCDPRLADRQPHLDLAGAHAAGGPTTGDSWSMVSKSSNRIS